MITIKADVIENESVFEQTEENIHVAKATELGYEISKFTKDSPRAIKKDNVVYFLEAEYTDKNIYCDPDSGVELHILLK